MMDKQAEFIDKEADFHRFCAQLATCSWFGFDTEFIGEKSFVPKLCLLQVVSEHGIFLIDTLIIKDLEPFLALVERPEILKITHAGDNDYRLLNQVFGTIPNNTFDTQIAAGFCGYNYPSGFSKLVDGELHINVPKGFAVADWEQRPLPEKILVYAIDDVYYLPGLWRSLNKKLEKSGRISWAREENRVWEKADFYENNPMKEVLASDFIHHLKRNEQVFLMRLYSWRNETAERLNLPREAVLPGKHISNLVRSIGKGGNALKNNRTLPPNLLKKHADTWKNLFEEPIRPSELQFLNNLNSPPPENPDQIWSLELVYHLVKKAAMDQNISPALLLPRGIFNLLKDPTAEFDESLLSGWRSQMLGPELTNWLLQREILSLNWLPEGCLIKTN